MYICDASPRLTDGRIDLTNGHKATIVIEPDNRSSMPFASCDDPLCLGLVTASALAKHGLPLSLKSANV